MRSPIDVLHDRVPGRLRLACAAWRGDAAACTRAAAAIARIAGVISATPNAQTGRFVVLFAPGIAHAAMTVRIIAALGGADTPAPRARVLAAGVKRAAQRARTAPAPRKRRKASGSPDLPHTRDSDDVIISLKSDSVDGLTWAEAEERLKIHGPNAVARAKERSQWTILAEQFTSLPILMLGGSAVISAATGGGADAAVTMAVAGANAVIGFMTEGQAEQTLRAFAAPASHSAAVRRGGETALVNAETLVPGDVLQLTPGAFVGADGRVIDSQQLSIDESILTGESVPVVKVVEPLPADTPLPDRANMVFMGTAVTGGSGRAVVTATGAQTEVGRVQALAGGAERPVTPVERELESLSRKLVYLSLAICAGTFGIGLLRGYGRLAMLKSAIALAVAAVPEGLPTVATTTLALGLREMKRRNVLIRRLDAVESLGALQVVCFDKTGTLTENQMLVRELFADGRRVDVSVPGEARSRERLGDGALEELLKVACLCSEAHVEHGSDGHDHIVGSSTEAALLSLASDYGLDVDALRAQHPSLRMAYRDGSHPRMASFHAISGGTGGLLAVKGSPDHVLAHCAHVFTHDGPIALTDAMRAAILDENAGMTARGLRVLGFAMRRLERGPDGEAETGLIWLGLAGLSDPVRRTAPELLKNFHRAGIRTVMITGDQAGTAAAVARELDLPDGREPKVVTGADIESLSPEALSDAAREADVFARVNPEHKLRIVRALQQAGYVVGMTGDGVNDGPALKAADIGIAMGKTGSDAAKDIANVVLGDDNLETLVDAIAQGRSIFANIHKSLHFLLATNLSEVFVTVAEALHGPNEIETPLELLWINLVTDVLPGLGLAMLPPDPQAMLRPPRDPHAPLLSNDDFRTLAMDAGIIGTSVLSAHLYALGRYGAGPQTRAVTFSSLVFAQLAFAYACRSDAQGTARRPVLTSMPLNLSVAASAGLQALPLFVPGIQKLLGIAPLRWADVPVVAGASLAPFLFKEWLMRRG